MQGYSSSLVPFGDSCPSSRLAKSFHCLSEVQQVEHLRYKIYDTACARLYACMCIFRIGYYTSFNWFVGSFCLPNRGKNKENGGFSVFWRGGGRFLPHFR